MFWACQDVKKACAIQSLFSCETSLAASAVRCALMVSRGPARPCGAGLASLGLALRRPAVIWFGVLPSTARWRRAL